ncbi:MAG: YkvA family protein [Solirubrobacterales bacterium]
MDIPHVEPASFWDKVRATANRVPFVDDVIAVWYCALDPATPMRVKAILFGAVAYFVLPFDAVPDFLVGLGYTDDLAVLMAAIRAVRPWIRDDHRERARTILEAGSFPS